MDDDWKEPEGKIGLLTKDQIIATVPERWAARYEHASRADQREIGSRLAAVRPSTEDAVAAIIGNRDWTALKCDVCDADTPRAVTFRNPYDRSMTICSACVAKAADMLARS